MGEMTRDEWLAMTDAEVLAHYRRRAPHCDLAWARAQHREALKWWHLGVAIKRRAGIEQEAERERLRRRVFGELKP